MEMKEFNLEDPQGSFKSETTRNIEVGKKKAHDHGITCKMFESAEVAINVSVRLEAPLIGKNIDGNNMNYSELNVLMKD